MSDQAQEHRWMLPAQVNDTILLVAANASTLLIERAAGSEQAEGGFGFLIFMIILFFVIAACGCAG